MSAFPLTLFALLLTFIPLQWSALTHSSLNFPRIPWNDGTIVLLPVLMIFYISVFLSPIRVIKKRSVQKSLFLSIIVIIFFLLHGAAPLPAIEVTRLLLIIWSIPFLRYVVSTYPRQQLVLIMLSVAVLHGMWAMSQFIRQDDLGIYFLGETRLDPVTAGIAKVAVASDHGFTKIVRAYGPYPHPNSLAAGLVVGWLAALSLNIFRSRVIGILGWVVGLALILTFSRAGWLAAGLGALVTTVVPKGHSPRPRYFRRGGLVALVTILLFMPFVYDRLQDQEDTAAVERLRGTSAAVGIIKQNLLVGVGINQYETALQHYAAATGVKLNPWEMAPVHSAPLLILAEWGVVGGGLLVLALLWPRLSFDWRSLVYLLPLLPLVVFDHYLATQTAPLVWIMAGVMVRKE